MAHGFEFRGVFKVSSDPSLLFILSSFLRCYTQRTKGLRLSIRIRSLEGLFQVSNIANLLPMVSTLLRDVFV